MSDNAVGGSEQCDNPDCETEVSDGYSRFGEDETFCSTECLEEFVNSDTETEQ